jgi:hypothetical protein
MDRVEADQSPRAPDFPAELSARKLTLGARRRDSGDGRPPERAFRDHRRPSTPAGPTARDGVRRRGDDHRGWSAVARSLSQN